MDHHHPLGPALDACRLPVRHPGEPMILLGLLPLAAGVALGIVYRHDLIAVVCVLGIALLLGAWAIR